MSVRIKEKIVKLLRLAEDRKGSPEGDLAQRMAEQLMKTHGVDVAEEDVSFEGPREVVQHCVAEEDERQWWMEMLLVTLCDRYGGEAISVISSVWRLFVVVEPEDDIDVDVVGCHFQYLCELVNDLRDASASEFMSAPPAQRDDAISSFCIGAVHHIAQMLYEEEKDLDTMPFMVRALGAAEHHDDFETQPTTSLVVPPPPWHPPSDLDHVHTLPPDDPPEVIEVVPDWKWFDCGYRAAKQLIRQVYPDT